MRRIWWRSRRFRVVLVTAALIYSPAIIVLEFSLHGPAFAAPFSATNAAGLLAITFTIAARELSLAAGPFPPAPSARRAVPAQAPAPPADEPALLARLRRLMEIEKAYREAGLTVAGLAARLEIPAYRVRRPINQCLGQRSFSSFLAALKALVLAFRWKEACDWGAALASLADALGRDYVVYRFLPLSLGAPVIGFAWSHRPATMPHHGAGALSLLFRGREFFYYWFHRVSHRVRWSWATHAIHHSSNQLNLAAAYRFGWTGWLSATGIFYAPLVWLGFPPAAVFGVLSLNLLYQFWRHATGIPKLGWLEYMFNTPSHHHVRHAANLAYLDANYGGVLIVFDRLFGTCIEERADLRAGEGAALQQSARHQLA